MLTVDGIALVISSFWLMVGMLGAMKRDVFLTQAGLTISSVFAAALLIIKGVSC